MDPFNTINPGTHMMVNTIEEEELLLSSLKPDMRVLEFGFGNSSVIIARRVKQVVSIEHDPQWPAYFKGLVPENIQVVLVPQNREPSKDYDDGTFDDFKNYVLAPRIFLDQGKFDIVFVDGRARVACARFAAQEYLKEGGFIFIHDYRHPTVKYRRKEYEIVELFLQRVDQAFAMAKFKVKKTI